MGSTHSTGSFSGAGLWHPGIVAREKTKAVKKSLRMTGIVAIARNYKIIGHPEREGSL